MTHPVYQLVGFIFLNLHYHCNGTHKNGNIYRMCPYCLHCTTSHFPIINPSLDNTVKTENKVHPRTSHEVPEWEYRYSCTLSLTSALDGKTRYPLYRGLGGPPESVWTDAEYLDPPPPTGIRSPDHPARKKSLYRLSYRGPKTKCEFYVFFQNIISKLFRGVKKVAVVSAMLLLCTERN